MGNIANAFANAFRDFQVDGDATSGIFYPLKSLLRALGPIIEANTGSSNGGLISGTGLAFVAGLRYSANTAVGPVSGTLPQLSTVSPGDRVIIRDVDFAAYTHNVTIAAYAGDLIAFENTANLTSISLSVNGAQIELTANASYWRASYNVG